MKENQTITVKFLASVGKVALAAAFFPYQIVINRKEGTFGMRSLALGFRVRRVVKENGKRSAELSFNCPGFIMGEAKEKLQKYIPRQEKRKHLRLKRSLKKKKATALQKKEA